MKESGLTLFDRWAPRLVCGLTAVVPLLFVLDLYDTFDLPKLAALYATTVLLAALWCWQAARLGLWRWRRTALDVPLLCLLAFAAISAAHSLEPALSFFGTYRIYVFGVVPMTALALLYGLTAQITARDFPAALIKILLVSSALAGLYGLLQYAGFEIFDRMPKVEGGRIWSSLGNPVYLGAVTMMGSVVAFTLCIDRFFARHKSGPPNPKKARSSAPLAIYPAPWALCAGSLVLSLAAVLFSLTRSAWIGCMTAFGFSLAVTAWRARGSAGLMKRIAVAMGAFLWVAAAACYFSPALRGRAAILFSAREESNAARVEGWKAALKIGRHYPWLGAGPDAFFLAFRPERSPAYIRAAGPGVTQGDAHNDALQLFSTLGYPGLFIYFWILAVAARMLLRVLKTPREKAAHPGIGVALAVALLALFVQNQFNFSSTATCVWAAVCLGALAGMADSERRFEKKLGATSVLGLKSAVFAAAVVAAAAIGGLVRADYLYQASIQAFVDGRYGAALRSAREAYDLNPRIETYETQVANLSRSAALQETDPVRRARFFDDAWRAACQETDRHPANPDAWNNRGVAAMWLTQLSGQDHAADARDAFLHALTLDPVFVDAWANLAKWHHLAHDLAGEKELWEKVLTLQPDHPMARQVLGYR